MRTQTRNHQNKHKRRHGLHHRHSRKYLKTYLPYLPLIASIFVSLLISNARSLSSGTLAYATEMSVSNLLQSTNTQRLTYGQVSLQLNQALSSAAQAKANDMIARNYWSHNTPDGKEPWVFMEHAGYDYQKAGENLAYGFASSNDTVNGWMNSPSHKANLLDPAFVEVGFGFANGNNYNNSGPETVVVAMYGTPQTLGASAQPTVAPTTPPPATPSPSGANNTATNPVVQPTPLKVETTTQSDPKPVNTDLVLITGNEGLQPLSRVQVLTGGNTPWALFAVASLCGAAVTLLLVKHSFALRHVLVASEKKILRKLHHPLFDSILLGIIILGYTLSRNVGFIG